MDIVQFRRDIDRMDPDLRRLLDLLEFMSPTMPEVTVVTSLTSDTVNPWGAKNAELERHLGGVHPRK